MPEKNRFPAVLTPLSHWDGSDVHPTLNQSAKGSGGVGASNQELFSQGGAYLVPGQPIPIQDGREMEKNQNGMGIAKEGDPAVLQPVCATGSTTHALTASSSKGATEDGTGRGTPIVIDPAAFNQGVNAQYEPHIAESEVMDSLVARGPHAVGQPIPFRKSKRACSTTDNETWVEADASNTLNNFDLGDTRTTHAVVDAVYENHAQDSRVSGPLEVAPTVAAKFGTGGGNVPLVGAMAVRRLTPVECERLQGFPDNWSRISWKGKPEDQCPDGPRYKACGNSMAVPVMRWIGERIAAADAKHFPHA
jgi:DNA (cytosine-5)-methyltransferase 1